MGAGADQDDGAERFVVGEAINTSRTRQPRPRYELEIDKDLFAVADAVKSIRHLQESVTKIAYADMSYMLRLVSSYEEKPSQHFASSQSAIADIDKLGEIQRRIEAEQRYIDSVYQDIEYAFPKNQQETLKFIALYWWEYPHTSIKIRKELTIDQMPFLRQYPSGKEPFYDYRRKIYERMGEVWGYSVERKPHIRAEDQEENARINTTDKKSYRKTV